ncbi:hypothetical protein QOT17_008718 [Balamuthia mandrillaris]
MDCPTHRLLSEQDKAGLSCLILYFETLLNGANDVQEAIDRLKKEAKTFPIAVWSSFFQYFKNGTESTMSPTAFTVKSSLFDGEQYDIESEQEESATEEDDPESEHSETEDSEPSPTKRMKKRKKTTQTTQKNKNKLQRVAKLDAEREQKLNVTAQFLRMWRMKEEEYQTMDFAEVGMEVIFDEEIEEEVNEDEILQRLGQHRQLFNRIHSQKIRLCFAMGLELTRLRAKVQKNWELFAEQHLSFSKSYIRKLQQLWADLGKYRRLQYLNVPSSSLMARIGLIREVLAKDPEEQKYWLYAPADEGDDVEEEGDEDVQDDDEENDTDGDNRTSKGITGHKGLLNHKK